MEKTTLASWFRYISLALLAAAITFSGRTLVLGVIDPSWPRQIVVRLEDILIVILGLFIITQFFLYKKYSIQKPPLYPILLIWVGFELVSSLINASLGLLVVSRILFYALKVIEYLFIFFYVFYNVKSLKEARLLMYTWMAFIWIHLSFIFYQLIVNTSTGIALIGENGNFNIGGQFLILFIYSFTFYLFYILKQSLSTPKKIIFGVIFMLPFLGTFTPGLKAVASTALLCALIILFLFLVKVASPEALKRIALVGIVLMAIFAGIIFRSQSLLYDFVGARILNAPSYIVSLKFRANIWKNHINLTLSNPLHAIIGRGGGDPRAEASHNQFVRNFTAGGIVGSVLFFILIFSILKISLHEFLKQRHPLAVAFSAGLFVSTIGMLLISISGEAFFIIRPAEHFWYFTGLAFSVIYYIRHKPQLYEGK